MDHQDALVNIDNGRAQQSASEKFSHQQQNEVRCLQESLITAHQLDISPNGTNAEDSIRDASSLQ